MPNWLLTILCSLAFIGLWTIGAALALWFRDRTGNSGRETHWTSNPRIKSRGEE
jgi:hypothetical protein